MGFAVTVNREGALRASEDRLRDFIDNAVDLILIVSPDGRIEYANRTVLSTLGFAPAEFVGRSLCSIVNPMDAEKCRKTIGRVIAGEKVSRIGLEFRDKRGGSVLAEGNAGGRRSLSGVRTSGANSTCPTICRP